MNLRARRAEFHQVLVSNIGMGDCFCVPHSDDNDDMVVVLVTEDEIKGLAKHWVKTHVPFFAGAESYGESAFVAGYEAAIKEWGKYERGE